MAHRIAIDCRIVERRQGDRRLQFSGDNAAAGTMERHAFDLGHRRDALVDELLHIVESQQRSRKCKTVVGKLRHRQLRVAAIAAATDTARLRSRSAIAATSLRSITGTLASGSETSDAMATI